MIVIVVFTSRRKLDSHSFRTVSGRFCGCWPGKSIFPTVNLPADFQCLPLLKTPYVNVVRAGHPLEAKLKKGEVKAADLKPYRRIQICVYPDTDDTSGGVPGAATIPMKAGKTMIWTESWLGAVRIMHRSDAVLTLP